jgi:hypothetical protein
MDVTVEIGTGGTVLSETAPSPSAGLQAREEYARIMSDPTHDKHAGYLRGVYRWAVQKRLPTNHGTRHAA